MSTGNMQIVGKGYVRFDLRNGQTRFYKYDESDFAAILDGEDPAHFNGWQVSPMEVAIAAVADVAEVAVEM